MHTLKMVILMAINIVHIMSDGTRLNDIAGHKVSLNSNTETAYKLLKNVASNQYKRVVTIERKADGDVKNATF